MTTLDTSLQTQLETLQDKLGMPLDELADIIQRTKLTKHDAIRAMLVREYGLGYYDAKTLVSAIFDPAPEQAS
jgi:hypothetical protein